MGEEIHNLFDPHLGSAIQIKKKLLGNASKAINSQFPAVLLISAAPRLTSTCIAVKQAKDWGSTRFCGVGDVLCSEAGEMEMALTETKCRVWSAKTYMVLVAFPK